jgi:hypothetical protein
MLFFIGIGIVPFLFFFPLSLTSFLRFSSLLMGTHNTRTLPERALMHLYITYYYTNGGGEGRESFLMVSTFERYRCI